MDDLDEEGTGPEPGAQNMEKQVSAPPNNESNKGDEKNKNNTEGAIKDKNMNKAKKKRNQREPSGITIPPLVEGNEPNQQQIEYAMKMRSMVCPPKYRNIYPAEYVSHDTYSGNQYCYFKSRVK